MKSNQSSNKHTSLSNKKFPGHVRVVIYSSLVLAVFVLFDLFATPMIGGTSNMAFYKKWIDCGGKPLHITSKPGSGFAWATESPTVALVRAGGPYFCTSQEAQAAGYAPSESGY